jgi:hypothetical protein
MNVFTGLAVGDVATVMSEAEQIKARHQMKVKIYLEKNVIRIHQSQALKLTNALKIWQVSVIHNDIIHLINLF